MQKASSGKLEDQEVGDLVNGIDPLWVLADRIIAQQEKKGMLHRMLHSLFPAGLLLSLSTRLYIAAENAKTCWTCQPLLILHMQAQACNIW